MTSQQDEPPTNVNVPAFGYSLLICSDFAQVLKGDGRIYAKDKLARLALSEGRVLLQARGGAGKTTLLHQALKEPGHGLLTSTQPRCVLIDVLALYASDRSSRSLQELIEAASH